MPETKHTPGPWTVEAVSDAVRITTRIRRHDLHNRKPGGVKIILARLAPPQIAESETHANARLMATAPDLLAALKALLDHHEEVYGGAHYGSAAQQAARDAIAKAEGRS